MIPKNLLNLLFTDCVSWQNKQLLLKMYSEALEELGKQEKEQKEVK